MRSHHFRSLPLFAVLALIMALLLSSCGQQASQEFSEANEGLSDEAPAVEAPATRAEESSDKAEPAAEPEAMPGTIAEDSVGMAEPAAPDTPAADELAPLATAPAGAGAGDDSDSSAARRPQGGPAALKAGEIDDNQQFAEYLNYLADYRGNDVRRVDVSERYFIKVLGSDQLPLFDAQVEVFADDTRVFVGKTTAGGQTLFLPAAAEVPENANEFRVRASYGDRSAETSFARHNSERVEVALPAAELPAELSLDLLFLLDTTGSMGDELSRIQDTIDDIAARIDSFEPRPNLRFGLVAYRDEGDEYVTRSFDFTADVAAFRSELRALVADGGGDTPEAVDAAMTAAVNDLNWSEGAVKLVFLVADAGPHIDRQAETHYLSETRGAVARGLKIFPIAASNTDPQAEYVLRQIAQMTLGRFIFLTYQPGAGSGAPGESSPLSAGEQAYTVDRLDDLIVNVVERELAAAIGER
jgi:hypothetical protein